MNVGGTQLDGFLNHHVYQTNDRRAGFVRVLICPVGVFGGLGKVDLRVRELLQDRVSRFTFHLTVVPVNRLLNRFSRRKGCFDFSIQDKPKLLDRFQVEWVADQHMQRPIFVLVRNDAVFASDRFRHQLDYFVGDFRFAKVYKVQLVELRHCLVNSHGLGITKLD